MLVGETVQPVTELTPAEKVQGILQHLAAYIHGTERTFRAYFPLTDDTDSAQVCGGFMEALGVIPTAVAPDISTYDLGSVQLWCQLQRCDDGSEFARWFELRQKEQAPEVIPLPPGTRY